LFNDIDELQTDEFIELRDNAKALFSW
jgi:hypothetical protein